jgi:hypothetical protein
MEDWYAMGIYTRHCIKDERLVRLGRRPDWKACMNDELIRQKKNTKKDEKIQNPEKKKKTKTRGIERLVRLRRRPDSNTGMDDESIQ